MNDLEAIVRELAKSPLIAATEIHGDCHRSSNVSCSAPLAGLSL